MSNEVEPSASGASTPPLPPAQLAYATPLGLGIQSEGIWRQGDRLITTTVATLPPRCVKCNDLGAVEYRDRKFHWATPWLLSLVLLNVLLYAIVALIVRKKCLVTYHLCQKHYQRRVVMLTLTWALALSSAIAMLGGPVLGNSRRYGPLILAGVLGGVLMILSSLLTGTLARSLTPVRITDRYAWFKGCCAEFLADLPRIS
jgi:hypothetical protein